MLAMGRALLCCPRRDGFRAAADASPGAASRALLTWFKTVEHMMAAWQ
jgi:hypothetical protein